MLRKYEIDPSIKVRKIDDLVFPPKYVYVNKFDAEATKTFAADVRDSEQANQPVVPVIIDSYGGEVYSLLAMVDVLKSCTKPIATIVLGKAMSCGAVLFTMGADGKRFMGPSSTLMIHDVSNFTLGKVEEIKADSAETDRLNQMIYKLMARNCGQDESYFLDIIHGKGHSDWFISPEEAVKHKLASTIRIPEFVAKISYDVKFG